MHVHEARLSDEEYFAEVERRLGYRAWKRRAARRHLWLACWTALAASSAFSLWWLDGSESVWTLASVIAAIFAMFLPIAWVGVGACALIAEAAEETWDLFFGED